MITKPKKSLLFFMPILSLMLFTVPQQVDARRNKNSNRNVNRNVNRNTNVNVNRNKNVNVNVNVDNHHGCCNHGHYHPVATGLAVGAAVAVTAAVIGSIVNTLPSGCTSIIRGGIAYQQCGSVWYQPQYAGNNVTYVVIQQPY